MPTVTIDEVPVHYEDAGSGRVTVCLVHGSGGSSAVWRHQIDGLADVTRVIAPDLPGHGRSGGDGPTRIEESVAIVRALLDAIRVSRVVIGGHSMGGAVAQAYALAHPERVAGLVLVGTGARLRVLPAVLEALERDHAAGVRTVSEYAVAADAPAELKDEVYRFTLAAPPASLLADLRACDAFDVMGELATITAPALIVCGEQDRLTPPKYAEFLRGRLRDARVVLVPGSGHYVQLERPRETTAAIREFVAGLGG